MAPDPASYVRQIRKGDIRKPERYAHNFIGANYLMFDTSLGSNLTWLRGGILPGLTEQKNTRLIKEQGQATNALLRAAAGLALKDSRLTQDRLVLDIAVQNLGAGHNLPTGVVDQKHMWLEIAVSDATGSTIYHSGAFDAERGQTDPDAIIWREEFLDASGNRIPDHLTFVTAEISHLRPGVPPKAEDIVTYDIPLQDDVTGPYRVTARLWYRVATQEFVFNTLKTDLIVPPFELANATFDLSVDKKTTP